MKPGTEISVATAVGQAVNATENPAGDSSLWDKAYDALKKEEPDRTTKYENLLSTVLTRGRNQLTPRYSYDH
jgi:hypothetical protein